jgi:hypothetical protein
MAEDVNPRTASAHSVTAQEVFQLCGAIEDAKVAAIVAAAPTYEELEEAVAWTADEAEPLGAAERSLSGKVAEIYEILATETDVPDGRD